MAMRSAKTSQRAAKSRGKAPPTKRKLKDYHPRKSANSMKLYRQKLKDLEHTISADVGSFLVLLEEGSPEQILHASQKAKSDMLKLAPDMQKLATQMGGNFPRLLGDFLNSVENILHTGINWIDDAKIRNCYHTTQRLEEALVAKKAA